MLTALGLSELEQQVYVDVLRGRGVRAGEATAAALEGLRELGLVGVDGDRVYPTPPDLALDSLLLERMRQLQEARLGVRAWVQSQQSGDGTVAGVETVVGTAAVSQVFDQILRGAQEEVLGFDRPPYLGGYHDNPTELELLGRGVRFRIVYDRRTLDRAGAPGRIGRCVAAGEEARVASGVPAKLFVADGRIGMLSFPGPGEVPAEPWAFVVRGQTWVAVLEALFAEVWDRGTPLRLAPAADEIENLDRGTVPTPADRQILSLLMAGLPDKAVASQLGMSLRTVQRRLRQLMDVTGSATRMQLGWYVARNDWL
ncbi:helix-turn-helix transcriptional regulator [Actinoplanes sp. RD1]|uniref:helix-turn-helix transcriptional regulator n=1 Tax=Actinoplanes sp. RD1 TaxID=3064538 RepID=UPI002741298C|nr:LuxR family transcriptional regulator [Actinoplanes sp. RD1]